MGAEGTEPSHLRFGVFELDLTTGELRKAGVLIHLPPQPFKILALLASRSGQLVTREEIQQEVWGSETFVDFEHGLNFAIKKIRDVLGDDAETPRYVETLPRRGYRFIYPVAAMSSSPGGGGDAAATPAEALTPGPSPQGRGEQGDEDGGPSRAWREEPELVSVPQPSPVGERVSRIVGTDEGCAKNCKTLAPHGVGNETGHL